MISENFDSEKINSSDAIQRRKKEEKIAQVYE
jgi:hypothetical protein